MNIMYRYARDADGALTDVGSLTPATRRTGAPFTCIACGRELLPHLGLIKQKHFQHKQGVQCAPETYLHQLAKIAFAAAYRRALAEGTPYLVHRRVTAVCTHLQAECGFRCERSVSQTIDLTNYFDQVAVEAPVAGYRADVLLSSSRGPQVLLIEFAVAHPCTAEKLASGFRIIEVSIELEEDIAALTLGRLLEGERRDPDERAPCVLHNFGAPAPGPRCEGRCDRLINVFIVHRSKKAILTAVPARALLREPRNPTMVYREVLGPVEEHDDPKVIFRQKVREAHFAGIPIANCFLCKYHGAEVRGEGAVFCKLARSSCSSNAANRCGHYAPLPSLDACASVDEANADFQQGYWSGQRRKRGR